jgi:uncharacterized damage-inducible protein DinB
MNEVERIHDQLARAFAGGAWHGPALRELLADVTSGVAARRVLPRAHTIWEIVLHIAAWERAALGRLEGKPMKLSPDEDWPPVRQTSEQAWGATLEMLEEGHRRLAGAVAALGEADLDRIVPGKEYSVYFLLHGIVQHDLYHAGQIALLQKS